MGENKMLFFSLNVSPTLTNTFIYVGRNYRGRVGCLLKSPPDDRIVEARVMFSQGGSIVRNFAHPILKTPHFNVQELIRDWLHLSSIRSRIRPCLPSYR